MKKLVRRLIVALLFGVAVYGAIILYSGASKVAHAFESFAWWTFAAACGLASSNYLLRFLKWEYYLAALGIRGVPKGQSFLIFLSGFVLTITPGKVGEVFKSIILNQLRGVAIARTAPIVVAERLTDLIGVIVMIAVGSLGFHGGLVWASAGAVLVVVLLVFVAWEPLSRAILKPLPNLPGPFGRAGKVVVPKVEEGLVQLRVLTTPSRLVIPTILSIAAWSLEGVAAWVILGGFGQTTPLPTTAFFYATATLAGALVPVPGGLGVTDKLLQEQLALLGHVPSAIASSAMLLTRFATLWFAVAVGFVALATLRALHPELGDPDPTGSAAVSKAAGAGSAAADGSAQEKTP